MTWLAKVWGKFSLWRFEGWQAALIATCPVSTHSENTIKTKTAVIPQHCKRQVLSHQKLPYASIELPSRTKHKIQFKSETFDLNNGKGIEKKYLKVVSQSLPD